MGLRQENFHFTDRDRSISLDPDSEVVLPNHPDDGDQNAEATGLQDNRAHGNRRKIFKMSRNE